VTSLALLLSACGRTHVEGSVRPLDGLTVTMRFEDQPIAFGAFYSGLVIVKTGDRYGWLTNGSDVGRVTVHETVAEVAGQAPDVSTSVISINPSSTKNFVWNLNYGASPAVVLTV
jgi:hypothetical protein